MPNAYLSLVYRMNILRAEIENCLFHRRGSATFKRVKTARTGERRRVPIAATAGSGQQRVTTPLPPPPSAKVHHPALEGHRKLKHLTDNVGNGLATYLSGMSAICLCRYQISAWYVVAETVVCSLCFMLCRVLTRSQVSAAEGVQ